MCGRFTLTDSPKIIAKELGFESQIEFWPRYNIAPSQQILVARVNEQQRKELAYLSWGFLPSWVKEPKSSPKPINAMAESAHKKPYFRSAFKKRRCLIPANGFYEWKSIGKQKQPFYIHMKDNHLFFFAGLWEHWEAENGDVIETTTILTTAANEISVQIHDRMPVILPKKFYQPWLDISITNTDLLNEMLIPYESKLMEAFMVPQVVNSPRYDGPECIERIS